MLTVEQIEPLVETHIARYSHRYEMALQGVRGYSLDAAIYLDIWLSIEAQGCEWAKMTQQEQWEAEEAYEDDT